MGKEAEDTLAIIGGHTDNALFGGHSLPVIAGLGARTGHKSATVEIQQHRQRVALLLGRGPYIQVQAVLAEPGTAENHIAIDDGLHRVRPESLARLDAIPILDTLGSLPAALPYRRLCVRDAQKSLDPFFNLNSLHGPRKGIHKEPNFTGARQAHKSSRKCRCDNTNRFHIQI